MSPARIPALLLALALPACGGGGSPTASTSNDGGHPGSTSPPLPWPALAVPGAPEPADNPSTPEKVDLGRLLFYDPILSSDHTVACATCHSEEWGMGDGMAVSVGIGGTGATGPGRTGPNVGRRNSLTLWNAAHLTANLWDGRAASLEDQVLGPLQNPKELALDPQAAADALAAIPEYASLFAAAFPSETVMMGGTPKPPAVTVLDVQRAIAAFERTIITDRAPYDQYVAGDPGALDADAQQGMFLFAKAGCAGCHQPPLFQQTRYADRGVAAIPGVADDGRYEVTHDPADRGAFRVPTLRNIRETGPYFHTGAVTTLDDAVHQEAALAPVLLSDDDVAAIVAFLYKGLIDPSRSPNRPPSVPSGIAVPLDGTRIPR